MISFFPFTHITAAQKQVLGAFFDQVRVLDLGKPGGGTPSRSDGTEPVRLVPCFLPEERAALLEAKLREYLSWAQLHRGNERNLKHLLKTSPYLKTDTDLTSIRSQISGGRGDEAETQGRMMDPGLFLRLAQTLDLETETISSRLQALDQGKEALLAELKGEPELDPSLWESPEDREDQGTVMPDRRISAWAQLAGEAGMFDRETQVLVTTSPGIFAWLTESVEEEINGLDIDFIKVHENECENRAAWFRDFENLLDQIAAGLPLDRVTRETLEGHSECCNLSGRIKIRLLPWETLNNPYKIPGRQLSVCLVGLNS